MKEFTIVWTGKLDLFIILRRCVECRCSVVVDWVMTVMNKEECVTKRLCPI